MNYEMIRAADQRLNGYVRRTPLLSAPQLDEIAGRRVLIKAENLQHTGSFKFRGGWSALSALGAEARSKGVIAFSSGNHAQGIAMAAAAHEAPATIVMPKDAPQAKIRNTQWLGADIQLYDRDDEKREELGRKLSEEQGLTLIQPYDEPQVIAGQGTCGLEIAKQAKAAGVEVADVLICCGGGGLTSGIALALEAEAPGLKPRPVEPEGFDDVTRSLEAGEIQRNDKSSGSLCDAILTPQPGDITFPIIKRLCGPGIVVTDEEALRAMALVFRHLNMVLEPGGAVAVAAALFHPGESDGKDVIAIASGGNVDADIFARAITEHGDTA
ncbi:threonine/serine dehydratase [Aestuariibius insulae]|uniref:threonine ammonia-lyase n=1 Tax=Aestuariibius insulae TaxID=2058287 RepID=UPI00345E6D55